MNPTPGTHLPSFKKETTKNDGVSWACHVQRGRSRHQDCPHMGLQKIAKIYTERTVKTEEGMTGMQPCLSRDDGHGQRNRDPSLL